ncbi:MAG: hypothetical protein AUJ96_16085 [Armatimonadetes bacterium CG2_30_66_41]|nr:MAG: hypothetical protein AUJ96_16085 [Armatimonadetes bacterium CG2_30_66_41]
MPEALVPERPAVWTHAVQPTEDTRTTMTYEEFLAWADEDTWAEWVDGEVIELSPASNPHQELHIFLCTVLNSYSKARSLGEVRSAPFQMKTGPSLPGREPDLLFVSRGHCDRLTQQYLEGPADLVVEIISPDSRGRDRGDKFYEYEEGGVQEYWILDPERRQAEFYQLGGDGVYQLVRPDDEGDYRSRVLPGLWLKSEWLWPDTRPDLFDVFKAWALI